MRRTGGIRLRLIGLALVGALPLVALGIYRLTSGAVHERRMVTVEAERAAAVAAARIDQRLEAADALLLGLSTTLRADPAQRRANESVLRRTLAIAPSRSRTCSCSTAGTLVATARAVGPSGDSVRAFANRGYFNIERRERAHVVGEIRRSVVLVDRPGVVVLARAITDSTGRFAGVVSMPVRLDSLVGVTKGSGGMGRPLVTIFDTSGVVLARSDHPDSVVGQQRFPAGVRIDTTGSGRISGLDGTVRLTGFTRTRTAPWMLHLGVAQSDLEARLAASLRKESLLFLLAIGLAVMMAYLLGQRITQPIAALVGAARAFERGETGTRAATTGPGEIRLLGNAFNQMAETVERRSAALADSERRYRFLFDSNPLPMWAWDADTLQIMAVNEAAVECTLDRERFRTDHRPARSRRARSLRARLRFENRQRAASGCIAPPVDSRRRGRHASSRRLRARAGSRSGSTSRRGASRNGARTQRGPAATGAEDGSHRRSPAASPTIQQPADGMRLLRSALGE
jgi:HAMP domain-containing protein